MPKDLSERSKDMANKLKKINNENHHKQREALKRADFVANTMQVEFEELDKKYELKRDQSGHVIDPWQDLHDKFSDNKQRTSIQNDILSMLYYFYNWAQALAEAMEYSKERVGIYMANTPIKNLLIGESMQMAVTRLWNSPPGTLSLIQLTHVDDATGKLTFPALERSDNESILPLMNDPELQLQETLKDLFRGWLVSNGYQENPQNSDTFSLNGNPLTKAGFEALRANPATSFEEYIKNNNMEAPSIDFRPS